MHPFENLPISSQASSFIWSNPTSAVFCILFTLVWKILYWEFSVMKLRPFLEYLSDRIRTVSFSHMLMVNGSKVAVRCIYARTASWRQSGLFDTFYVSICFLPVVQIRRQGGRSQGNWKLDSVFQDTLLCGGNMKSFSPKLDLLQREILERRKCGKGLRRERGQGG